MGSKNNLILVLLWAVLTAFNINKAFHIDDSFHLLAAQEIAENPSKPMSAMVNWGNDPAPISVRNQPPLFFYMVAAVGTLFGYGEIPMHLFLSIFTFLSLFFFQKILLLIRGESSCFLLILFAFCPAFLVNQNLMTDVPILSLALGAVYFLLKAANKNHLKNYLTSGLLLSAGVLIKYSMLPLIAVVIIVILVRGHLKYLGLAALPLLFLLLWSWWNYLEYGEIHILNRPNNHLSLKTVFWDKIPLLAATVGAIAPFAYFLATTLYSSKILSGGMLLLTIFNFILIPAWFFLNLGLDLSGLLNALFILNGSLFFLSIVGHLAQVLKKRSLRNFFSTTEFIFLLSAMALALFVALFAPFMATRHVLLCIPFFLLFIQSKISNTKTSIKTVALVVTIFLGTALGISDWHYANFYRKTAKEIEFPKGATVWSLGHWGWQWYSKKKGWNIYGSQTSKPKKGDYMVFPTNTSMQWINENLSLEEIELISNEPQPLSYFSVSNFASMYVSYIDKSPWTLDRTPFDQIFIKRVK